MEECNRNGRWSRSAQCLILNFPKSFIFVCLSFLFIILFIPVSKCTIIFIHVVYQQQRGAHPDLDAGPGVVYQHACIVFITHSAKGKKLNRMKFLWYHCMAFNLLGVDTDECA